MRLWLLALLILAPLCRAGEGEPLRVMTDLWPPFRMEDESGQLQGLDIDLLAELSTAQRRLVVLLPGVNIKTGPDDFYPIEREQLMKFDGKTWQLFGKVYGR